MDMRLARKKAGFTQGEIAHLVGLDQSTYSDFERGIAVPSLRLLTKLSLIYGRSFPSLIAACAEEVKPQLRTQLSSLPKRNSTPLQLFNRSRAIARLNDRIAKERNARG